MRLNDPHPPETGDTRRKLIDAAGEVFAELGFQAATVRDICQKAGANVAAVNYHFGGKEELYREVLTYSFVQGLEKYPLTPDPAASAEAQLEQFVWISLERMLDEGKPAWHGKLMVREMANPTGEMDTVAEKYMRPHFAALQGLVRRLLGPDVPEARATLLCLSTMGQVVFYKLAREAVCRVAPQVGTGPAERKEIARHIARVTIAAARDIRGEGESDRVTR